MNKKELEAFRTALQEIQGTPWVNTLAVDDQGTTLYMNAALVPNVPQERLEECADKVLQPRGLPGLDGSSSYCNWQSASGSAQPGVVPGHHLPTLLRQDFVQNSNDSAWLSNPAAPLVGFSPLISREGKPLGLRARYALGRLEEQGSEAFTEDFLRELVTDNRVHLADLVLDDLLAFCTTQQADQQLTRGCAAMADWDRHASLNSGLGLLYFQYFMSALAQPDAIWQHPFDPQQPLHTPRGIAWQKPEVAEQLEQALRDAVQKIEAEGRSAGATWGQIQSVVRGMESIPVPGGDGKLGIYNDIQSRPTANGHRHVVGGSSYIQLVSFGESGPVAQGLLSFSQSSEPSSPHFMDQTQLFSRQQWQVLPFTREQIEADPDLRVLRLEESSTE